MDGLLTSFFFCKLVKMVKMDIYSGEGAQLPSINENRPIAICNMDGARIFHSK